MANAVAWVVPVGNDLKTQLSLQLVQDLNENTRTSDKPIPGTNADLEEDNRRDQQVAEAIEEWRGAIRTGNKIPLSQTASSVPPESKVHVIALAAWRLVSAEYKFKAVIITEQGAYAPLQGIYRDAMKELDRIRAGGLVSYPTDPEEDDDGNVVPAVFGAGDISSENDYYVELTN